MPCPHYQLMGVASHLCKKYGSYQSQYQADTYCTTDSYWKECVNYHAYSNCFLTTACVHYAGLPDDCKELTGMRNFRDGYLLSLPNGQAMFDEYYRLAPAIVEAIERSDKREHYLADILARVRQCVFFADNGNNEAALDVYTAMFDELKNRFAPLPL